MPGYLDELYPDIPCPYHCAGSLGTPIVISGGQDVPGINFAIRHGARVGGRITSSTTGLGIANVRVELYSATATSSSSGYSDYTLSDAAGNWLMPWAYPTGTYYAKTVAVPGFFNELYDNMPCNVSCDARTGTPIAMTLGATTGGIDFALDPAGTITGTVTAAGTGAPLAGVTVSVYSSNGTAVGSATTNASGVYTTTGLAAGTYYIQTSNGLGYIDEVYNDLLCNGGSCPSVTTGTGVSVTQGAATSGINFSLAVGGSIMGTVTAAEFGVPVAGVNVFVYNASGASLGGVSTNASGVYTKGGLLAGPYYVRTSNSLGYIDELFSDLACNGGSCPSVTTGTGVVVALGAAASGINFSLAVGGSITGTVTAAGSGVPLSSIRVYVYNSVGTALRSVYTDASGVYTLRGLMTGTYCLRTSNAPSM